MWWRSKRSGWSLLGFIPVIRPLVAFASSVHVRNTGDLCSLLYGTCIPKEDGVMSEGTLRDALVMRAIIPINGSGKPIEKTVAKALLNQFSIHCEWNPCWWIPGYDPFANPGCIIHQLDHGVFDIVLDLVIQLFKSCFPAGTVGHFDGPHWHRFLEARSSSVV